MQTLFQQNFPALLELCQACQVQKLYVFGSVLTARFSEKSDLDFLVEMVADLDPLDKGEYLWQLWDELERLFARKVDLLTPESLKNPYLIGNIERTKKLIYDRNSEKIFV